MRILVATHNYPRRSGDHAGAFVARLTAGLQERGHEMHVVAPHAPGLADRELMDGVAVERFHYGPDALEGVAYRGDMHRRSVASPVAALGIPSFFAAFALAIRRAERRLSPHLVHAHWWLPAGWLASRSRAPLLITCHGSDVRLLDRSALVRRIASTVLRRASATTTVSDFLRRDLAERLKGTPVEVRTLRMPVDTDTFERGTAVPKARPARVLYAGNMLESKGVADLLQAFAILQARGVTCALRLVGAGPDRANFEMLTRRLGVAERVTWAGTVAHDRMAEEFGAATITVLPSRGQAEGLGLTLVEALASACAVVGTRAGGIPEVVRDGETGLLARSGDPPHLAAQLERLLLDEPLRTALTRAGSALVRAMFAPAAAVAAYDELYREVVGRAGGRSEAGMG
jgi:glycosyltransferase involved in cell wall biosynthesis